MIGQLMTSVQCYCNIVAVLILLLGRLFCGQWNEKSFFFKVEHKTMQKTQKRWSNTSV